MPGRTYNKVPDCESIVVLNTNETFVNEDYDNGEDGEWQDDQLTFTSTNDELVILVDTEDASGAVGSRTYSTVVGEDYTIAFDYDISSLDTDSDNTYEFGVLLIQSKYVNGNFVTVGTPQVLSTANSGVGNHSIALTDVDAELMGITLKVFSYNSTTTIGESFIIDDFTITGTTVTETFDCSGNNYLASNYRFGFNGKEMDSEVSGQGNSLDFGARIYNSRLGKFLSVDPKWNEYSMFSSYLFAANSPITLIDRNGENWDLSELNVKETSFGGSSSGIELTGTVTLNMKILNFTDKTINTNQLASEIGEQYSVKAYYPFLQEFDMNCDFVSQDEQSHTYFKSNVQVKVNLEVVNSISEIDDYDHVMILTDNFTPTRSGIDADSRNDGGISDLGGPIAVVGSASVNKNENWVIKHEIAHWLKLKDKNNGIPDHLLNNTEREDKGNVLTQKEKGEIAYFFYMEFIYQSKAVYNQGKEETDIYSNDSRVETEKKIEKYKVDTDDEKE